MDEKKNLLTYEGLKALEDELHDLKVNRRKEVAGKIKEAREQGDLSENAEYDAAKDEQRDIEARIEQIEKNPEKCGSCRRGRCGSGQGQRRLYRKGSGRGVRRGSWSSRSSVPPRQTACRARSPTSLR